MRKSRFPKEQIVGMLEHLIRERGHPNEIDLDNGPELISRTSTNGPRNTGSGSVSSKPGKPE